MPPALPPDRVLPFILDLFAHHGQAAYIGEAVSQTEHGLQAAALAEAEGAPPELIVAALLHDIGHLLDARSDSPMKLGVDLEHEDLGAAWMEPHFAPGAVEPVRLHVPAKRYLCAVDPAYLATLSPASVASLQLQGGPMGPVEAEEFRRGPFADAAVRLRRWDDAAKVPGLATPPLEHFVGHLRAALRHVHA